MVSSPESSSEKNAPQANEKFVELRTCPQHPAGDHPKNDKDVEHSCEGCPNIQEKIMDQTLSELFGV